MKKQKIEKKEIDKTVYSSLVIDNVKYKTLLTKKYTSKKPYAEINNKLFSAFIPGTVIDINVEVGQKVAKGDSLFVFEAMKMLNEIKAPFDSVVKHVLVNQGDKVVKYQTIVELE